MSVTIHMIQSSDWPAWVQAIGSFVAILVAVAVPYLVSRHERRRYRSAGLGLAREAVAAINLIARICGIHDGKPVDPRAAESDKYELTVAGLSEYMRQFPVDRLGDAIAVKAFIRIAGAAGNAVSMARQIQEGNGLLPDLRTLQASANQRLAELEGALGAKVTRINP
jgi:hypothetical protein